MISGWKKLTFVLLLGSAACARNSANETTDAANAGGANAVGQATGQAPGTTAAVKGSTTADHPPGNATAASILAWSTPAAGSTVNAPVNELVLHFEPPARLGEVTVTGPEGAMPMMVTAVGEVEHYSLPLSGLDAGRYAVAWRASTRGVDHRGSFGFEVR